MGLFSKLMGGLVGFGLGGPIGAIIGVLVVNSFSSGEKTIEDSEGEVHTKCVNENRFIFSLLVLIASVLKADGVVKKDELPYVKSFLLRSFGEQKAKEALQMLKEILNQDVDSVAVASQLSEMLDYSVRLELLHMLFNVANGDGNIAIEEVAEIERITIGLKISQADYRSIRAMFGEAKSSTWAYDVLDIAPSASNDDVKRAYRKLALKYHPDKVEDLGEDIKRSSEEKFKQVKNAYDQIMSERK